MEKMEPNGTFYVTVTIGVPANVPPELDEVPGEAYDAAFEQVSSVLNKAGLSDWEVTDIEWMEG